MSVISFDSHLISTGRPAALRLTRRGRLVVAALACAVVAVLVVLLGSSTVATDSAGSTLETTTLTVQPGQTLWSIAAEANPDGNVHDTIDDIVRLNALPNGSGLKMGTSLAIPVYGD